jgi:hypothetical protein
MGEAASLLHVSIRECNGFDLNFLNVFPATAHEPLMRQHGVPEPDAIVDH